MLELFHALADPGSARVRRFVEDHELEDAVRLCNTASPEVEADLRAHGGTHVPAVWDGTRLHVGADACIARLLAEQDLGRAT